MQVDEATVRRIARLARIKVTDAEAKALEGELSGILDWVKQLDEVDTKGVEPMTRGGVHDPEDARGPRDRRRHRRRHRRQRAGARGPFLRRAEGGGVSTGPQRVPSPSWGRAREGGMAEHQALWFPPPLTPPHKGEGNSRTSRE